MRRRNFIAGLAGTAGTWPFSAIAQQPAMPVIGFLSAGSATQPPEAMRAFHQGLSEAGFVEGQNVMIEYRWAEGYVDRLAGFASDLVRLQPRVIVATGGTVAALAAKKATTTIPIVFAAAFDPVEAGLVASFNRPGGNLTGVVTLTSELVPKRLELLHEVAPQATTIAVLLNPTGLNAGRPPRVLEDAARALRLQLEPIHASSERDFETVFATLVRQRAGALMIPPDSLFLDRRDRLGALTLRYAIPAIHSYREFAAAGGLMSYGGDYTGLHHQIGIYSGRVLKGESPANLPVQQSTTVDFVINLKTAKAFGLTVPPALRAFANEVIE
jgi:putative ABC transport system substrate-binding protein